MWHTFPRTKGKTKKALEYLSRFYLSVDLPVAELFNEDELPLVIESSSDEEEALLLLLLLLLDEEDFALLAFWFVLVQVVSSGLGVSRLLQEEELTLMLLLLLISLPLFWAYFSVGNGGVLSTRRAAPW